MKSQLLIDNDWVNAQDGATFERRHPVSNAMITEAAAASIHDAKKAADSAQAAYKTWRLSPPSERRRLLLKAADILESKTPKFIETMAAEVGASALWAGFNVHLAANVFREAASLATQIQGETIPTDKPGALSMTIRQPVGVILSMVPWNGTVVLAARAIAYPIVCGNPVVFRGSEASPKTHALIAEALVEAGFPPGVLNYLSNAPQTAPEVVDTLIAHKAVRRINFTGSTRVGRIVAEKAAQQLKRCLLELGGKSPLIVLDDANVDEAVKAAVFGSFLYQGQICMSTERCKSPVRYRTDDQSLVWCAHQRPASGRLGQRGQACMRWCGRRRHHAGNYSRSCECRYEDLRRGNVWSHHRGDTRKNGGRSRGGCQRQRIRSFVRRFWA